MALSEYGTPFFICTEEGRWEPAYEIPFDCSRK